MKLIKTLVVACAFSAVSAYAVDPVKSETTCAEIGEKYAVTAAAKERFADLEGTCEGIYEIDGHEYARASAVVRQVRGSKVRLYMPATDHTFEVTAGPDGRVWIGGRKIHPRNLRRGDEIGIYLSVAKFTEEKVTEIAMVTDDAVEAEVVTVEIVEIVEVEALPTTGQYGFIKLVAEITYFKNQFEVETEALVV